MPRPVAHPELDRFLLEAIGSQPQPADIARLATEAFAVSRQSVNRHLRELVRGGVIRPSGGRTRPMRYELIVVQESRSYVRQDLQEHEVWQTFVRPLLEPLPENVRDICHYGLTEMVNNAIDHSEGSKVIVDLELDPINVRLFVLDDGVGVFKKIKDAFGLERESDVFLELSKGKLTTDPSRHTGEGIFFSSRMFDSFSLGAGSLFFHHFPDNDDWLMDRGLAEPHRGTTVVMQIDPASMRSTNDVFEKFAGPSEFRFDVTHVPVKLAQLGDEALISRSQGKRLVARFEKFAKVVLNFAGVNSIGQAFADEVFRVFPTLHPEVMLTSINASDAVQRMIRRVEAGQTPTETPDTPGVAGY